MADTCTCPPASNIYCSAFVNSALSATQPSCQLIPNGDRVDNPLYDTVNNISYFSYGIELGCGGSFGNIQDFLVVVCENIPIENVISVDLLLDGCPDFISLNFDFNNTGGQTPPAGFKYLRAIIDENIVPGSSGVVRIALSGNFPAEQFATFTPNVIVILSDTALAGFPAGTSSTAGLFASCPQVPRLTVLKRCEATIANNLATLSYSVDVSNTGNADITNVTFNDTISFNGSNVNLGTITVTPDTLNVNTDNPGVIQISGDLGPLAVGESIPITYVINIASFTSSGTYTFNNLAIAQSPEVQGSAQCAVSVEVVELTTDNCCVVNADDTATFRITLNNLATSPATMVSLRDILTVPAGVVIQFTSFDVCSAVFVDDLTPVPLNTDITDRQIEIRCAANIPQGATMLYNINFTIVSTNNFANIPVIISNVIQDVTLQDPTSQILLRVTPLPNTAEIDVNAIIECQDTSSNRMVLSIGKER